MAEVLQLLRQQQAEIEALKAKLRQTHTKVEQTATKVAETATAPGSACCCCQWASSMKPTKPKPSTASSGKT